MMKTYLFTRFSTFTILILLLAISIAPPGVHADGIDAWWVEDWPYRIQLTVSGPGAASVNPDFSALFSQLGLPGALLDLDSIRIVPYSEGKPGEPVPYEETLSTLIMDGETLNLDSSGSIPYWTLGDQASLALDSERYSQGAGSVKAELIRQANLSSEPDFAYNFKDMEIADWSAYETLTYDVWPEVNETAIDQTTDLYQLDFLGMQNCALTRINGPSLAMDQWNRAATSLIPLGNCTFPDASDLRGIRFFLLTRQPGVQPGGFDVGDRLTLWLDNLRLVDQNGCGEIRWTAEEGVDTYYLYFDTLNHTGHTEPELTTFTGETFEPASTGEPEAGGYLSRVAGATTTGLTVWSAPAMEKIFKTQLPPILESPLLIQAACGEFEAFQVIFLSPEDRDLPLSLNDLIGEEATIPANQIQVFRVDYIQLSKLSDAYGRLGDWPDPLYPLLPGDSIHLTAGKNQPLWVRVEIPGNTPPGLYTGSLLLGENQIPYTLEVWDFTLPESAYLVSGVGLDWDAVRLAYGASNPETPAACVSQLESTVLDTLSDYHLTPNPDPGEIRTYTLTNYEVQEAQTYQSQTGEPVWWEFTGRDLPPFVNPAVMDRTGLDARLLPSLAWLDRVDGLYYAQITDWYFNPWMSPFSNDLSNGDGFLFYPPNDDTLGDDPCLPENNRMVPSIRLELFREGLEDYAYLYLLNKQFPEIGVVNDSDLHLQTFIASRTAFDRSPNRMMEMRQAIAGLLTSSEAVWFNIFLPLMSR